MTLFAILLTALTSGGPDAVAGVRPLGEGRFYGTVADCEAFFRAQRARPVPRARRAYASRQKPEAKNLRPPRQHQQRPTHGARKPGFAPGFAHRA